MKKPIFNYNKILDKGYMDPVHEVNGKWYYWLETWADKHGPFKTRAEAKYELDKYCKELNYTEGV